MLIATLVVCLVAAGTAIAWWSQNRAVDPTSTAVPVSRTQSTSARSSTPAAQVGRTPSASQPANDETPSEVQPAQDGTPATAPVASVSAEDQALAELQALRTTSLSKLVLDGRWVAQVASKSVGIEDPLQRAANGTHVFYAADILAESRAAQQVADPSSVLVVQSVDFGKRTTTADGEPYWVTIVDIGFRSRADVNAWCARSYPLLTAEELANACAPRTLSA